MSIDIGFWAWKVGFDGVFGGGWILGFIVWVFGLFSLG